MITSDEAFRRARKIFDGRCTAKGIETLSGGDPAMIAAHGFFSSRFSTVAAQHGDKPEFEEQAVQYAMKCITSAILANAKDGQLIPLD